MAHALIPLKDLVRAKTRLAGVLSASERRALAQAMVEDVLAVLGSHSDISRVTLVSDDPGAAALASLHGADYLAEQPLACSGLNAVLANALPLLQILAGEQVLVVHGDLPLLGSADVSHALNGQRAAGGLFIGCDRHGTGTNLLVFDTDCSPAFCFGQDSCRQHQAWAAGTGVAATVGHLSGVGLDVDEPADLAELLQLLAGRPGHTARLLFDTDLGRRLRLSLASLLQANADVSPAQSGAQDDS